MKERPILFSGPMVRAILSGAKTQTRRVVKPQPSSVRYLPFVVGKDNGRWEDGHGRRLRQPPRPGDRLWVRETWKHADWTEDGYPYIRYAADNAVRLIETIPDDAASEALMDRWADLSTEDNYAIDGKAADRKWRPSIHIPRWASRIDLLVKEVRVERLQEISEEDALAEGIGQFGHAEKWSALGALAGMMAANPKMSRRGLLAGALSAFHLAIGSDGKAESCTAHGAFAHLWESINADKHPWASNPWVWVVEFERVKP